MALGRRSKRDELQTTDLSCLHSTGGGIVKRFVEFSVALGVSFGLSSCAMAPVAFESAQQANDSMRYTLTSFPESYESDELRRFLDDKRSILYMQNQGGGGVAVGLLFGALGALANAEMIKKQTTQDAEALKGKLSVDVNQLFKATLASVPSLMPEQSDASAPRFSPVLYVEKIDDDHIRFASLLYVSNEVSGKKSVRQYIYELPEIYSKSELQSGLTTDQTTRLGADTQEGFKWIVSTYLSDQAGTFNPQEKGVIHSDFLTPRIQIPLNGYRFDAGSDRIGFATVTRVATTIYSLPADAATITN
jgi:hypothetical protein